MTAVVLVTAEELAAGRVVLPPKVVKEVRWMDGAWRHIDTLRGEDPDYLATRERTVSQSLPESQCPDCDDGTATWTEGNAECVGECWTCEGRGSLVVVHLAIWQAVSEEGDWFDAHPDIMAASFPHERRQAIVGYVTNPTVLPVVAREDLTDDGGDCISFEGGGKGYPVIYRDNGQDEFPTEPWAQGLVPGSVVLLWDTVTPIDPPITSVRSPLCDCDHEACQHPPTQPLSLEQGQLTEVNVDD